MIHDHAVYKVITAGVILNTSQAHQYLGNYIQIQNIFMWYISNILELFLNMHRNRFSSCFIFMPTDYV